MSRTTVKNSGSFARYKMEKTFVDNPDRQYRCLTSINNQKTIESWRRHTGAVKNIEVRDYVSSIPSGAV